jgi:oligoribonuclease
MRAIFLDIETTGLDASKHHALDIAFKIIDISTRETKISWQSIVKHPQEVWEARDPKSIQINEFTWDQMQTGKEPAEVSKQIISIFSSLCIERGNAVFICQNPSFDRGFFSQLIDVYTQEKLNWPYHWLDFASMYWAILVQKHKQEGTPFPELLNLSKNEIAKYYHLPPENTPHRAMQGVEHLIQCYETLFNTSLGVTFHGT